VEALLRSDFWLHFRPRTQRTITDEDASNFYDAITGTGENPIPMSFFRLMRFRMFIENLKRTFMSMSEAEVRA